MIDIKKGEDFCCLALGDAQTLELHKEFQLLPRTWVSFGLPAISGEHWKRWLGELHFNSIRRSLVLTVTAPIEQVATEKLKQKLHHLLYASRFKEFHATPKAP